MQSDEKIEQIAKLMHDQSDDDGCNVPWGKQLPRYRSQQRRQVRKVLSALTAAGYRILGPDELDPVTVERCAAWHDIQAEVMEGACEAILKRGLYPDHAREANARLHRTSATAIRSLIPAQPEAKEARDGR